MSMMHASQRTTESLNTMPPTAHLMRWVIVATAPGLAAMTFYFGLGVISNVLLAALFALGAEALVLKLRQRPLQPALRDQAQY